MRSTYLVLNQSSEAWVSESKYLEFAVVGMAESRELPAAFQVDCWDDDDECEEEGDGDDSLESRQSEAKEAGMIQVGAEDWREAVTQKLSEITEKDWEGMGEAIAAIEKASKATCVVRRKSDSQERIDYHERLAREARSDEKKEKKHREKAKKARKQRGGIGTGLLLRPRSHYGYLVITNNHVVMNEEEAKDAKITFDYLKDDSGEGMTKFDVSKFLAMSPPTVNGGDRVNLDFSILAVACSEPEDEVFLKSRGVSMEETGRIQATGEPYLKMCGLKALPLIMFSHPRSLAMRIGVSKYPDKIEDYPVTHIKHSLPTLKGSSGGNILYSPVSDTLYSPVTDKEFVYWYTGFVHYRHGYAVAWQAIGPQLRDQFAEKKTDTLEAEDRLRERFDQAVEEHPEQIYGPGFRQGDPYQRETVRGELQ